MNSTRSARRRAGKRLTLECLEQRSLLSVNLVPGSTSNFSGSFTGMDIYDGGGYEPPDTIVAVGPNNVVEMVNTAISVYDKSGSRLSGPTQLSSLFPQDANLSFSDPQVTYDELARQFFVGAIAYDFNTQTSHFDYAVLGGADASVQNVYSLDVREPDPASPGNYLMADFPRVGWNADAYFVTVNMFQFTGSQSYEHVQELTLDKSDLAQKSPYSFDTGGADFTLVPATMHDAQPGDSEWFVEEAGYDNGQKVNVVRLVDPLNLQDNYKIGETQIPVPSYGMPPSAAQPGGGGINTGDTRILSVVERGGHLLATQSVGTGGDAHARWYDFELPADPQLPFLHQSGEINPGRGIDTYYPAIEVNTNGDIALTYMESSRKEYMSMYVTGRMAADPLLGTMQTPLLVQSGQGTYAGQRAGDYSGIGVDPSDGLTFWAASEYATSPFWGTAVAHFSVDSLTSGGGGSGGGGTGGGGHSGGHGPRIHYVTWLAILPLDDPWDLLLSSTDKKHHGHSHDA